MKKILLILSTLALLLGPHSLQASFDTSISYIQAQPQNAWFSQALAAADVSSVDISYIDSSDNDLMTAVKNLLALAATESSDTDTAKTLVATIKSHFNAGQLGSSDLANDDFWGTMALAAVGDDEYSDQLRSFILSVQNEDGGWSWSTTADSDSNDTAAAVMALLELGLDKNNSDIILAMDYIRSTQNSDGGFAYDVNSESDGASTAWILATLNKLGEDLSSWTVELSGPTGFLQSLEQADGSYLWLEGDSQGSAIVTAYALVALSGSSYPVNYIDISDQSVEIGVNLRIEGPDGTICLITSDLVAGTVLEALSLGADVCGYEYVAEDTAYGVYVSSIDGLDASGTLGWHYWVNWQGALVSAAQYELGEGDEVLWAWGDLSVYPTKIEVNSTILNINDELIIDVSYYDSATWQPKSDTLIKIGDKEYTTDANGHFVIAMPIGGIYPVYKLGDTQYVTSNKKYITVGDGISKTVALNVNIKNDTGGGGTDTVAFSVDQSNIDFGDMNPGQAAETILSLSNIGNVSVYIEASIEGDSLFADYTELNKADWEDYNTVLNKTDFVTVNVELSIPSNYNGSGAKTGQLIFWAIAN